MDPFMARLGRGHGGMTPLLISRLSIPSGDRVNYKNGKTVVTKI
jgi:hypothetical protein